MHRRMEHGLGATLACVISNKSTRCHINRLVSVCHALGIAHVRMKQSQGRLASGLVSLSASDLAYDCIAELFQYVDGEGLVQLRTYFGGLAISTMSDLELLSHLRRLVCSKVNNRVYWIYRESDPVLSRIIRNIKLGIDSLKNFSEEDFLGETYIAPIACEPLEDHPPFEREALEREFRAVIQPLAGIPQMLSALSLVLREQDRYCRRVSLVDVAMAIKASFVAAIDETHELNGATRSLEEEEMRRLVHDACDSVRREFAGTYVYEKDVQPEDYKAYFLIIE